MEPQKESLFENLSRWVRTSITLKLASIAVLVLLLLIPASMIQSLISDREGVRQAAIAEVSAKWANPQTICGPVLTVPFIREVQLEGKTSEETHYAHFLPETLDIKGNIQPQTLKRGIYEITVYSSDVAFNGRFADLVLPAQKEIKEIRWQEAFLTIGLSDLRGIEEEIRVNWSSNALPVEPGSRISTLLPSGITLPLRMLNEQTSSRDFSFALQLQGSEYLRFVPAGKTTSVQLQSPWTHPSFDGYFLPDNRQVDDKGFSASWKILQLNRNYPQHWIDDRVGSSLLESAFGVNLLLPVDDYQKSMRSAKYALLIIGLTFLVFFLVEVLRHRQIHPFQYTLVGLALCLFYVLLVSISEHSNFNLAYGISGTAVILMITLYSTSIFRNAKVSLLLMGVLAAVYCFVFATLQLKDYALLLGSIGLTLILGLTMYLTRNISWYPNSGKDPSAL